MKFKEYLGQLTSVPNDLINSLKSGGDAMSRACDQSAKGEFSPLALPIVLFGVGLRTVRDVHGIVFNQVTTGMEAAADSLDAAAEWVNEKAPKTECNSDSVEEGDSSKESEEE